MKKKIAFIMTVVVLAVAVVTACGSASGSESYDYRAETTMAGAGAYVEEAAYAENDGDYVVGENFYSGAEVPDPDQKVVDNSGAKIIRTADIDMQTTDFDTALENIDKLVVSLDGAYFEQRYVAKDYYDKRYAEMVIRVPSKEIGSFTDALRGVASVTSERQNAQDVSESYYDTEARLNTAKTKLARLQKLLEEAADLESVILLEEAISDTEYEIDDLQGTLKHYDSRIDFSAITVTLNEVDKELPAEAPVTFGEKLSAAFHDGIDGFIRGAKSFALWIAENWTTVLILFIIFILPGIILIKVFRGKKKRALKKAEAEKKQVEDQKEEA